MKNKEVEYQFLSKPHPLSSDMGTWIIVSLPKELSIDIRDNFKRLEEGWGRLKVVVKIGNSEWNTSIWFDTKQDTYLLPLKATIRKKESIVLNKETNITIWI